MSLVVRRRNNIDVFRVLFDAGKDEKAWRPVAEALLSTDFDEWRMKIRKFHQYVFLDFWLDCVLCSRSTPIV